jgi:excisionase family DNA binding protein
MARTPVIEADKPIQTLLAEFVTQNEAAALLNLRYEALRARVYRGSIASVRAGSAILISRSEIERVQRTYTPRDLPVSRTHQRKA